MNTSVISVVFRINLLMRSIPLTSSLSACTSEEALAAIAASWVLNPGCGHFGQARFR